MITLRELYINNEGFKNNEIYLSNSFNMFAGVRTNQEAEKIYYLNDDIEKRDKLRELLKNRSITIHKRKINLDLEECLSLFDSVSKYQKYNNTGLFFGRSLWGAMKRELELKCYLDDIIKNADEKTEINEYEAICYLIDQKYIYHRDILDAPKDDFIYREEMNNIIFDYLQLKIDEISQKQPPENGFIPIIQKPLKWTGDINILATLFNELLNSGFIKQERGAKENIKRLLLNNFVNADGGDLSKDYLDEILKPSKMKTDKETARLFGTILSNLSKNSSQS